MVSISPESALLDTGARIRVSKAKPSTQKLTARAHSMIMDSFGCLLTSTNKKAERTSAKKNSYVDSFEYNKPFILILLMPPDRSMGSL